MAKKFKVGTRCIVVDGAWHSDSGVVAGMKCKIVGYESYSDDGDEETVYVVNFTSRKAELVRLNASGPFLRYCHVILDTPAARVLYGKKA